jgi:hypothetical protein
MYDCHLIVYLILIYYHNLTIFSLQVTDQNLEVWQNTAACVPDALRHYYYQYLSSTTEAAEVFPETFRQVASYVRSKCSSTIFSSL